MMGSTLGLAMAQPASAAGTPLIGTFTITAGSCSGGAASGTYLRMVLSGGTNAAGPYFSNSASTCSDNSYTPLAPGAAGGLVTGSFEPQPYSPFDSAGNSLSDQITAPVAFEGVKFGTATNPVDPQTGLHTPAPAITANGTSLSGDLAAFGVSWNKQEFNQGSPKPDGSSPGNTTPVVGTYDAATGAYVLQWSSQVVGGPFNGFSAFWNLTGRFVPAASSTGTPAPASGSTPASTAQTSSPRGGAAATGAAEAGPAASAASSSGAVGRTSGDSRPTTAGSGRSGATHVVVSMRTTTTGAGGWRAPLWLVILVVALGVLGLAGVLWSEQSLRRHRPAESHMRGE